MKPVCEIICFVRYISYYIVSKYLYIHIYIYICTYIYRCGCVGGEEIVIGRAESEKEERNKKLMIVLITT